METIQEKAEFAHKFLMQKTRDSGDKFWCCSDDAPSWMTDLCREAHAGMFPDDYKYEYIEDALEKLYQYEDADEIDIEADAYNSDLFAWVASHSDRTSYADDALKEFGATSIIEAISYGQEFERREVLILVRNFLENLDIPEEEKTEYAASL